MKRWLAGLLLLAVLGGFTWYFLGSKRETTPATSGKDVELLSAISNVVHGPVTNIPAALIAVHPLPVADSGEPQAGAVIPPPRTAALSSPVAQAMTAPNPDDPRPVTLLENVRNAVIQYGS